MSSTLSQNLRIIDYCKDHGSITPMDALNHFGCFRLSARMFDIRAMGYDVTSVMETRVNEDGEAKRYARYHINF